MTMSSGDTRADKLRAFLAEPRNVMVGAIRRDGRPQMTPNWFYWDGARFYISTTRTRAKYKNLRRDPRVQLVLDDPTAFRTVVIDGTAEFWEDIDRGLPFFKKITEKHGRPAATDEAWRERLTNEQRVLLVIHPEKPAEQWLSWGL